MYRLILLLFPFLIVACAVQRSMTTPSATQEQLFNVQLLWQQHTPYCGGAYPSPEQAMGWNSPLGNQEFVILYDDHLDPNKEYTLKVYHTDSDGIARLKLPKGTYYVYRSEKFESIEALEKKYRPTNEGQIIWAGIDCLKQWQSSPDLRIDVSSDTAITLTEYGRCFQGTTPCVDYIGPYPP